MVAPDTPLVRFYREDIARQYRELDGSVSEDRYPFASPDHAAAWVDECSRAAGAHLVGFTRVRPSFVFRGTPIHHGYAVVLGYAMDHGLIHRAPAPEAGTEVLRAYWRLGDISLRVAAFIRSLGYPALVHHPRSFSGTPPTILHTVAGLEAGLGEVGRLGVLITREFGPRVRLATITTDLPLPGGGRKEFGVTAFCSTCRVCLDACRGKAIPGSMKVERGYTKYTIDPWRCLPEFARYDGCNICVARCVLNRPENDIRPFLEAAERKRAR